MTLRGSESFHPPREVLPALDTTDVKECSRAKARSMFYNGRGFGQQRPWQRAGEFFITFYDRPYYTPPEFLIFIKNYFLHRHQNSTVIQPTLSNDSLFFLLLQILGTPYVEIIYIGPVLFLNQEKRGSIQIFRSCVIRANFNTA